jgi:hypothetical protein
MVTLSSYVRLFEQMRGGSKLNDLRQFANFVSRSKHAHSTVFSGGMWSSLSSMWKKSDPAQGSYEWGYGKSAEIAVSQGVGPDEDGVGGQKGKPIKEEEPEVAKKRNERQRILAKQYLKLLELQAKVNNGELELASSDAIWDNTIDNDNILGLILRDLIYGAMTEYRNGEKDLKELKAFFNSQVKVMQDRLTRQ